MASNSKQWSSATPGYIIFLVDQSGSMNEPYPEKGNKANFTSMVINRTINELINVNMAGDKVKDRVFISIIGYGNPSINEIRSDYISKYAESPIRIETGKQKVSDGNGGLIEMDVQNPIWLEPTASQLTPMGSALEFAKKLVEGWMSKKPDNPAPVIINISDGLPYPDDEEQKSLKVSKEIMALSCSDGTPIIFNAHLGDSNSKCICPESIGELPDDQAKFLFEISSKVPDTYIDAAQKQALAVKANSKGFVSNADPETFIKFINFGSSGGSDKR
ncbi:MAG: VWA domain-containing protein [Bacteroidales bacterium]|nr:VWA domain-containing protein [Bacteroidales bacterium]